MKIKTHFLSFLKLMAPEHYLESPGTEVRKSCSKRPGILRLSHSLQLPDSEHHWVQTKHLRSSHTVFSWGARLMFAVHPSLSSRDLNAPQEHGRSKLVVIFIYFYFSALNDSLPVTVNPV